MPRYCSQTTVNRRASVYRLAFVFADVCCATVDTPVVAEIPMINVKNDLDLTEMYILLPFHGCRACSKSAACRAGDIVADVGMIMVFCGSWVSQLK